MEREIIRTHRVGSVTFGATLVVIGVLFLLHVFFPGMGYRFLVYFWPLILIGLGVEVLFGCRQKNFEIRDKDGKLVEQGRVVYDGAAIFLTLAVTLFALLIGTIDWAMGDWGYIRF